MFLLHYNTMNCPTRLKFIRHLRTNTVGFSDKFQTKLKHVYMILWSWYFFVTLVRPTPDLFLAPASHSLRSHMFITR